MAIMRLSDFLTAPDDRMLHGTPYEQLGATELADFLATWEDWHRMALAHQRHRIHPTASIHPTAIIGDDVIIGPHVRVWEFSSVRSGSVLCAGVSVGFNCEITRSFIGERTILGHRIGINRTLVGADAHLSANLTVAAISLWSPHMSRREREIAPTRASSQRRTPPTCTYAGGRSGDADENKRPRSCADRGRLPGALVPAAPLSTGFGDRVIKRPLMGLVVMGAMLMATACTHSHHHSSHSHTTVVHHTVVHHHVVHHH